jgi:hypothetical protein
MKREEMYIFNPTIVREGVHIGKTGNKDIARSVIT